MNNFLKLLSVVLGVYIAWKVLAFLFGMIVGLIGSLFALLIPIAIVCLLGLIAYKLITKNTSGSSSNLRSNLANTSDPIEEARARQELMR